LRKVFAASVVLVVALAFVGLWLWPGQRTSQSGSERPGAAATEPLSGELTVRVWAKGLKNGLPVQQAGALPVHNGEKITLTVRLNEPAHVYLVWLDSEGGATPLHPWNPGGDIKVENVAVPPPVMDACSELSAPLPLDDGRPSGYPMEGKSGLETILLLARRTPLPENVNLTARLGKLTPAPFANDQEVAVRGLDRGVPIQPFDQFRRPGRQRAAIDDSLMQLMGRLQDDFEVIRAVRFAHTSD
jgi:hypothetical protein